MRSDELDRLATRLGTERGGVVTAADLRAAGADPDTVRTALARRWQAPVRGVYVPHRRELTAVELAHVAVAHAGAGAVLTGLVAARALGMRWVPDLPGAMVLVEPERRRASSQSHVLVRRFGALSTLPTTPWKGLLLAPAAQVVVDAGRQVAAHRRADLGDRRREQAWLDDSCLREVRGLVLGAVADRLCSLDEVRAVVEAGAMRDSALLRRAVRDAERGATSPPEAELIDGLLGEGVPFWANLELHDDDGLVVVLDVYLAGTGVGGELDSRQEHGSEQQLDATLQRHRRVQAHGAELLHVPPTRYRTDPAGFHSSLIDAARDRLGRGLGDPPGLRLVPRGPLLCGPRPVSPPFCLPTPMINVTSRGRDAA